MHMRTPTCGVSPSLQRPTETWCLSLTYPLPRCSTFFLYTLLTTRTNTHTMHMPGYSRFAVASSLLLLPLLPVSASPLSSCYGNSTTLDWYIDAVGETPCMTYQRLRQICNIKYQTPSWAIDATTDQCDDPLSTCCCNSIAWSVRMLCINCQWDEFGTTDPGHSANPGAYYVYRWSSGVVNQGNYCGDGWNQTLPDSLQLAVCQNRVRLEDFLYKIFWPDGSWNFLDYEQQAQQLLASQNQSLNYCNNTQNATSTASSAHTAVATSEAPVAGKVNLAAAVGGSLGGVLGLLVIGAIVVILLYRGRLRQLRGTSAVSVADSQDLSQHKHEGIHASIVTPFFGQYRAASQSGRMPKRIQPPHVYGEESSQPSRSYSTPSVSGYGEEGYGTPVSMTPSTSSDVLSSDLQERDAGRMPFPHLQLPPEYRTVYSS
ncbi:hypothetical protein C8Q72DRAFT_412054 [Fomitopsis betulina]|nr:hypothetical protein C8Q72DRAFT_412054 [Fomitopsis betulina]